jgi:peptidoglycan-N-acetylglucosamine deacetylase
MHWIWSLVATLTFQRVRVRMPRIANVAYLTFDDGPHPTTTPELLDLLARLKVKATFFLIGDQAKAHPEIVRRLVSEGHAIGNHSMSHPNMRKLNPSAQLAQVDWADAVLAEFDGRPRHMYRPPRGHATVATILRAFARAQPLVLWSFDSLDHRLGVDALVERLNMHLPQGGDILLFHDDMPATIEALGITLPRWRTAGLRFATL